jgi:hypothetical protein
MTDYSLSKEKTNGLSPDGRQWLSVVACGRQNAISGRQRYVSGRQKSASGRHGSSVEKRKISYKLFYIKSLATDFTVKNTDFTAKIKKCVRRSGAEWWRGLFPPAIGRRASY